MDKNDLKPGDIISFVEGEVKDINEITPEDEKLLFEIQVRSSLSQIYKDKGFWKTLFMCLSEVFRNLFKHV